MTNKTLAVLWLCALGSNAAEFYSHSVPYQGFVILGGAIYFFVVYRRQLLSLLAFADFGLVLFVLVAPLFLMLLSSRSFTRSAYTSQVGVALVFMVASLLAVRSDLQRILVGAAFLIVALGVILNVYELFVDNNVWSTAPGRSAGFYVNPNVSGGVLVAYGFIFLLNRSGKLSFGDFSVISLVSVGVVCTFSRAAIIAVVFLMPAVVVVRSRSRHVFRTFAVSAAAVVVSMVFSMLVYQRVDLSVDAWSRMASLTDESFARGYREHRGEVALKSLSLVKQSPVVGVGVGTVLEMAQGPHNMFVGILVDYGAIGLTLYLTLLARLTLAARRADRSVLGLLWFALAWFVWFGFSSHNLLGEMSTTPLLGLAVAKAFDAETARMSRWRGVWSHE